MKHIHKEFPITTQDIVPDMINFFVSCGSWTYTNANSVVAASSTGKNIDVQCLHFCYNDNLFYEIAIFIYINNFVDLHVLH